MKATQDPMQDLARQYREAIEPSPAHVELAHARLMERLAAQAEVGPPPARRVSRMLLVGGVAAGLLLVWGALRVYIDLRVQQTVDASLAARDAAAQVEPREAIHQAEPARSPVVVPVAPPPIVLLDGPVDSGTASLPGEPAPEAMGVPAPPLVRPPRGAPEIDADALLREGALLSRAREAQARGDWSGVLLLVDAHKKSHPQGALLEERLVLEAAAACSAGQQARGQKAAQTLRRRFPRSLALARVDDMCKETDDD